MKREGFVYILASGKYRTLYTGVTNDLLRRLEEHRTGKGSKFAKKYSVVRTLVYYEIHERIEDAIVREKPVKEWKRDWKLELIERMNPEWRDLYNDVVQG